MSGLRDLLERWDRMEEQSGDLYGLHFFEVCAESANGDSERKRLERILTDHGLLAPDAPDNKRKMASAESISMASAVIEWLMTMPGPERPLEGMKQGRS